MNAWRSMLPETVETFKILSSSIAAIRTSDDVLETKDWTVDIITVRNDVIQTQETIYKGVTGAPENMTGWSIRQLVSWLRRDYTGYHPESYNEIKIIETL